MIVFLSLMALYPGETFNRLYCMSVFLCSCSIADVKLLSLISEIGLDAYNRLRC